MLPQFFQLISTSRICMIHKRQRHRTITRWREWDFWNSQWSAECELSIPTGLHFYKQNIPFWWNCTRGKGWGTAFCSWWASWGRIWEKISIHYSNNLLLLLVIPPSPAHTQIILSPPPLHTLLLTLRRHQTHPVCPVKTLKQFPVCRSVSIIYKQETPAFESLTLEFHKRIVLSLEPLQTWFPFSVREVTHPLWPLKSLINLPV
jgi:hypothetical protein